MDHRRAFVLDGNELECRYGTGHRCLITVRDAAASPWRPAGLKYARTCIGPDDACRVRSANRPAPWLPVDALMRLLPPENRGLLATIARAAPRSVSDLAARSGRDQGNLSRPLERLEQAGLVRLVPDGREKRPEMVRRHLRIELDLAEDRTEYA